MENGGDEYEGFQSQFSAVLQPIKDLNKNWSVDLSSYLQQYLEKFVHHANTSTELGHLNFAQAAMLIQSSAHIYGKKVQFLYNLTCEFYEQLINKKKNKEKDISQNSEGDSTGLESETEQFLTLDDVPVSPNTHRHSSAATASSLRTPVPYLLTMRDDLEKGKQILLNVKGSQLGKRNDSSLNRFLVGHSGFLSSCGSEVDLSPSRPVSGVLPLPNSDLLEREESLPGGCQDVNNDFDASVFHNEPTSPPPSVLTELPRSTEKRTRQSMAARITSPDKSSTLVDLFQNILDPHEVMNIPEKPLKERKVHRSPHKAKKMKRRRVSEESKENVESPSMNVNLVPLDINVLHDIMYSNVSKFPRNPLKIPHSEVFYHQYYQQRKKDMKTFQETTLRRKQANASEEVREEEDHQDFFGDEGPGSDPDLISDEEDPIPQINLENLPINQHNAEGADQFGAGINNSQNIPVCTSYEELARERIAQFQKDTMKFHCGTDVGKKVAEWEEKIQPYLDEEDTRRAYDIHAYGTDILNCFQDNNRKQTIAFVEIVKSKERFEIPRYFLSSLMLANCHNVELTSQGDLEKGMDTLELTLLSRKRHHEMFEEFRAPSKK